MFSPEEMLAAEEACKASVENYLEEPPPARPVSTYLHSFNFNDSILADLWFVPDGGKSEFVLHLEDEAAEHSLLVYCATKDLKGLVRKVELHGSGSIEPRGFSAWTPTGFWTA